MGQAASMCRFKGCRYKKSKSGLQLRSIEEPSHHNHTAATGDGSSSGAGGPAGANTRMPLADQSAAASPTGTAAGPSERPSQTSRFASAQPSNNAATGTATNAAGHAACPNNQHQQPHLTSQQPSSSYSHHPNQPHQNHHHHPHHHHHLHHNAQPSSAELYANNIGSSSSLSCNQPCYDPEYARMETWMDENPEFVQDYFIRKATRQIVDSWLVSHATSGLSQHSSCCIGHSASGGHTNCCSAAMMAASPSHHADTAGAAAASASAGAASTTVTSVTCSSMPQPYHQQQQQQQQLNSPHHHAGCGQSCSSRSGSGATTPVRKISAHEFERGGLIKPIVNTIDGTPTFLSVSTVMSCTTGDGGANASSVGFGAGSGSTCTYTSTFTSTSSTSSASAAAATSTCNTHGGSSTATSAGTASANASTAAGLPASSAAGVPGPSATALQSGGGLVIGPPPPSRMQRLSRNELRQLDEKQLIFELVKDICNELDVRSLCHKILQNVSILLKADRGSLFLVEGRIGGAATMIGDGSAPPSDEATDAAASDSTSAAADNVPKKCLVSKLFDVCPRSTVADMEAADDVCVAWGTGIAGYVADSGEPVNIPDAYADPRFNDAIDSRTGYRTQALLCMPIKDSGGEVLGVAQVINKLNGDRFTAGDEKVFASYLQFCGIGLRNAQLYEQSQLEIKRNQVLLDLARMIFEEQSTIEHMVLRILTHMQSLIQCQRVQILLVHEASKGSFSRVFDFEANDLCQDDCMNRTSPFESRFPINIGVTGHVATTGETVNIPDAYADGRFDDSVDDGQLFKHHSILCMAIKNSLGQIIGVIQLVNKFNRLSFTRNDENFVEAFAIFCGMGIHNTHMYEKAIVAMAKQSVTLEVLSYHASATVDDAVRLKSLKVPSAAHFQLHDFRFDDILMEDDDTLRACLRMFLDMDFVNRFHIDYEVLCRWLLSVKKNYRNVTYHNWRHAFNVAQMMFSILTATQWWKIFGEIECLALIIACLCHDLDHRGTNNSFQIKASSPLAQLYSTSTMEHHHFDQCLMILNSPGNQVLGNLSSDDYSQVIHVLEDAILSTDLAVYFRKRGPFLKAVGASSATTASSALLPLPSSPPASSASHVTMVMPVPAPLSLLQSPSMGAWCADEPRQLLRAMSMTVCDLSAITKPWPIEKRTADLVSSEFFEQGDIERSELNITPIDIMNREMEDQLPMMQVGFIDSICMPIYEAFSVLSHKLVPLIDGVRENKHQWLLLAEAAEAKKAHAIASVPPALPQLQQPLIIPQQQQKLMIITTNNNNNNNNVSSSINHNNNNISINNNSSTTTTATSSTTMTITSNNNHNNVNNNQRNNCINSSTRRRIALHPTLGRCDSNDEDDNHSRSSRTISSSSISSSSISCTSSSSGPSSDTDDVASANATTTSSTTSSPPSTIFGPTTTITTTSSTSTTAHQHCKSQQVISNGTVESTEAPPLPLPASTPPTAIETPATMTTTLTEDGNSSSSAGSTNNPSSRSTAQ